MTVLVGDALKQLRTLEPESVQTCVTSPPYWGLRDYGNDAQIGLEKTPDEYVARMVAVFAEVRRVLRDDGTLWLNLGDSYAGGGGFAPNAPINQKRAEGEAWGAMNPYTQSRGAQGVKAMPGHVPLGLKPKDLVGIPWRVAFALQADGWYLRSDIIWHKPNPMPESVTDRPTKAHEYLFLLAKSERYYYDAGAIAERASCAGKRLGMAGNGKRAAAMGRAPSGNEAPGAYAETPEQRNRRSVWTIPTRPFAGAHFAVFPPDLITPCILAGSRPGDVVLDPFTGSGTTGVVAKRLGREFVGVELNPEYAAMARGRMGQASVAIGEDADAALPLFRGIA